MQTITIIFFSFLCFISTSASVIDSKRGIVEAERVPRYSCPEVDVDFDGHDIDHLDNVESWQNCGLY